MKYWSILGVLITALGVSHQIFKSEKPNNFFDDLTGSAVAVNSNVQNINVTNNFANEADPNFENRRNENLSNLNGEELIRKWFELMNNGFWKEACSLRSKDKCNSENGDDVLIHSKEPRLKAVNGYQEIEIWHNENAPQDLWCVKYKYQERQSIVKRDIVLIMQYKLSRRSDGGEDIASSLCEKTWMEGIGDRPCAIPASIHFCT